MRALWVQPRRERRIEKELAKLLLLDDAETAHLHYTVVDHRQIGGLADTLLKQRLRMPLKMVLLQEIESFLIETWACKPFGSSVG